MRSCGGAAAVTGHKDRPTVLPRVAEPLNRLTYFPLVDFLNGRQQIRAITRGKRHLHTHCITLEDYYRAFSQVTECKRDIGTVIAIPHKPNGHGLERAGATYVMHRQRLARKSL